jgi:hypothetical protein
MSGDLLGGDLSELAPSGFGERSDVATDQPGIRCRVNRHDPAYDEHPLA